MRIALNQYIIYHPCIDVLVHRYNITIFPSPRPCTIAQPGNWGDVLLAPLSSTSKLFLTSRMSLPVDTHPVDVRATAVVQRRDLGEGLAVRFPGYVPGAIWVAPVSEPARALGRFVVHLVQNAPSLDFALSHSISSRGG